ncbi:MAG: hypothetical protein Q8O67_09810 [Deltaproteobacteria bacterium]|nr:hypothetical protein [Deltaproteobacteria bacterium]
MRAYFVVVTAILALPVLAAPRIEDVKVNSHEGGVDVVITASEPLTFQSWMKGGAVVVDLLDAEGAPRSIPGMGAVKSVEITRHDVRGAALTRLSLPLIAAQDYDVSAKGNTIVVAVFGQGTGKKKVDVQATLRADALQPVLVASSDRGIVEGEMGRATATDAPAYAQAAGARTMTYIGFKNSGSQSRVFARMNDTAQFNVRKEGDNLIVLEIKNATIPLRNNKNHLDSTFFDSPVKMITPSEIEDATPTIRITIEMKTAVPFETKVEGREIAIYFKK